MLMVYVGANGRDNMNFHGSMLPRAFKKEQKNEGAPPVEERGGGNRRGNAHGSGQTKIFVVGYRSLTSFT